MCLRKELGLTYDVTASLLSNHNSGIWLVSLATEGHRLLEALESLHKTIKHTATAWGKIELLQIRSNIRMTILNSIRTTSSLTSVLEGFLLEGLSPTMEMNKMKQALEMPIDEIVAELVEMYKPQPSMILVGNKISLSSMFPNAPCVAPEALLG